MSNCNLACLSLCPAIVYQPVILSVCIWVCLSFFLSLAVYSSSYPSCSLLPCLQVSAGRPACLVCLSFNDFTCAVRLSPCLFDKWYVCLSDSLACCHSCSYFCLLSLGCPACMATCLSACYPVNSYLSCLLLSVILIVCLPAFLSTNKNYLKLLSLPCFTTNS